ncbi:MAG: MATE family efflux transporter [Bacilli bacterium]
MNAVARTLRTILYKFGVAGLAMVSGLFLVPRYLTVADNGIYKLILVYAQLCATYLAGYGNFFNFGLNRRKLPREALVGVIMRLYVYVALAAGVLTVVCLLLAPGRPMFGYVVFAVGTVPLAVLFGYTTKLVQALNEIDWLNRLNTIQVLCFVVFAVAIMVARHFNAAVAPHLLTLTLGGWFLSYLIAAVTAYMVAARLSGVRLIPSKHPELRPQVFAYGRKTSLQQLLTQFNLRGDLILVGILAGATAASLYGMAVTASEVLWHISSSISLLIYARVAAEERSGSIALVERTFRFTLALLIVSAAFMLAVFPPLIHYALSGRYDRSIPVFEVLLPGTIAYGATALFSQFFTDQLGKVKFPLYMQAASIAANALICFLLIPRIGIMGGALASSAAYFVSLTLCIIYFRQQTKQPLSALFVVTRTDRDLVRRLLPHTRRIHEGGE